MSVAGPSIIRVVPRSSAMRSFRPPFASPPSIVHPRIQPRSASHHRICAANFSTSPFSQRPDAKRGAYTLAHPVDQPSGFEGVPAPAYIGEVDKGKARASELGRKPMKAKKNAITMTPSALDRLRALLADDSNPKLLRIGVKSRGCAGMAYHLDYVAPPGGRFDEVVEQEGVRVLIDSKALFSIIGSVMDWRDNRLSAGFVFDNPNVVDTCGCGESFNIR